MGDLSAMVVGGLIAAVSGAATTILADRLGRRNKQYDSEREAIIAWVSAFEQWVSLYHDFAGLVLAVPETPDQAWKDIYLERMKEASEAGRRLDVAKNSVLVVARRGWVRAEVQRLTETSKVPAHSSTDEFRLCASAFRATSDTLRKDMSDFLLRLVDS